jgi:hypothetical protein
MDFHGRLPGLTRTAEDGAQMVIRLANLNDARPLGGYFAESGRVRQ